MKKKFMFNLEEEVHVRAKEKAYSLKPKSSLSRQVEKLLRKWLEENKQSPTPETRAGE